MRKRDPADRLVVERIGRAIAEIRKARGQTREAVAALAGVHPNTVKRVELGGMEASSLVVTAICAALGCGAVRVTERGFEPRFEATGRDDRAAGILAMPPARVAWRTGESVAALRRELGHDLRGFARLAGIHHNTLWNLERGLVAPSILTLYKLCRAGGVEWLDVEGERLVLRRREGSPS